MRYVSCLGAILVCLGLVSCTSTLLQGYEGPALPDNQTALIGVQRNSSDRTAARVRIVSIDTPQGEIIPVTTGSVRVLPRATCVEARARTSTLDTMSANLCFEAYAGRRYEVRASTAGSQLPPQLGATGDDIQISIVPQSGPFMVTRLLVIDVATREIVAVVER